MMISGLFNVGLITRYVYLWAIWIQRFHNVSFHKFWHAINVKAMNWSTSGNVHGRSVLCEVLNQTKRQLCRGSIFNWTTDAGGKIWAGHRGWDEVFGQHALERFTVNNGKNGCFCDNLSFDIPKGSEDIKKYNASMAHKLNHSFDYHVVFSCVSINI